MLDVRQEVTTFILDNMLMVGGEISEEVSLQSQGVIDSTGVLELVGFLETRFGIAIKDEELRPENLDSIRAIEGYVHRKLATSAN